MATVLRLSFIAIMVLVIFVYALKSEEASKMKNTTCEDRCALYVLKNLKPKCQCDGLCVQYRDCCSDYREHCQTKLVAEKDTTLARSLGTIVGVVFSVVFILALAYFLAVRRKQIRRQKKLELEMNRVMKLIQQAPEPHSPPVEPPVAAAEEETKKPEPITGSSVDSSAQNSPAGQAGTTEEKAAPTDDSEHV